jgi:integrase/recombinase XerD
MHRYLTGFRLNCVAEGKSPRTVRWYEHKLRIFSDYLRKQQQIHDFNQVEATHVRAFLVHLQQNVRVGDLNPNKPSEDKSLSPCTVQGYHRAIRVFFSWLIREEYLLKDPTRNIRRPKAPRTIVPTFDSGQIQRLLAVPNRNTALGYRDYCLMLLLLDTGIRLSELSRLELPDLHLEEGVIQIRGKGDKERLVPVGNKVRQSLWRYISKYRPEPAYADIESVFLNREGLPFRAKGIYSMIVRRGQTAELEGVRCSPHTFRHTFAVNYLRNGGDVFSLQRILGHSSLVVTRMYVNLADSDIRTQHRRYGPVDQLGLG